MSGLSVCESWVCYLRECDLSFLKQTEAGVKVQNRITRVKRLDVLALSRVIIYLTDLKSFRDLGT